MNATTYSGGNELLDRLPAADLATLRPLLDGVELETGATLYGGGADIDLAHVYFPITAVASMLATLVDGSAVEAGTVGREGMIGAQCVFGSPRMIERWVAQVPGSAVRIPLANLRDFARESRDFDALLHRYLQYCLAFLAQSTACNARHSLLMRCARWLLLTHDRVGRDRFFLTHEYLAVMLGVRRPSVSIAAAELARAGYLTYARGHVQIVDRIGLETVACECYDAVRREAARLLGDASADAAALAAGASERSA